MNPAQYLDYYIRETARRINVIRRCSGRHFEAAKFCREVKALFAPPADPAPFRA